MLIIPAVDILDGSCVRLRGGDYDAVIRHDDNPADAAKRFFDAGARRLHVVDLDAAKTGEPTNIAAVQDILADAAAYDAQVQIGGGLRTFAAVETILDAGAAFAVLGTAAVRDETLCAALINAYPGKILVGMDSRDGRVAVAGWCEDGGVDENALLSRLAAAPPAAIIRTDIRRDGMLRGIDAGEAADIAARAPCPLIVSGGVASVADIRALAQVDDGENILGVIVGQALYGGALSFADAVAAAR